MRQELSKGYFFQKTKFELSKQLVEQKTHHRSTAIRRRDYRWILQSIDYVSDHGEGESLSAQYESGKIVIQEMIHKAKQQMVMQKQTRIPIQNERYLSILDQQLPDFFASYDPEFRSCYCKEDLDYPLLDGLAMQHQMYHKQGIDLVCEYLRRYTIEETFLHQYREELMQFFAYYEAHYDVFLEFLGANLCEIVLQQALFSTMLSMPSLIITEPQANYLCHKLCEVEDVEGFVASIYQQLCFQLPKNLHEYLKQFLPVFTMRLRYAIKQNTLEELIIIPAKAREKLVLQSESCNSYQFQRVLEALRMANTEQKELEVLMHSVLGIEDYLDIFHMELLKDSCLASLFASWDVTTLAVLFYQQYKDQYQFHQHIDFAHVKELMLQETWESVFLDHLCQLPPQVQQRFLSVLQGVL